MISDVVRSVRVARGTLRHCLKVPQNCLKGAPCIHVSTFFQAHILLQQHLALSQLQALATGIHVG